MLKISRLTVLGAYKIREFGIIYTFLTYATHGIVASVKYHRSDYLCIILIIDAFSVIQNNHFMIYEYSFFIQNLI